MPRHAKTWVLVTDGVRARILPDVGDAPPPEAIEIRSATPATHLRDILSDAPGRSFASDGSGRRASMEPGFDPVLHGMHVFAGEILTHLAARRRDGSLARLAIVAAPRMLGILRREMPETLREAVILESPLNLAGLSEPRLRDRVSELLRSGSASRH